jgi:hypothetical protein
VNGGFFSVPTVGDLSGTGDLKSTGLTQNLGQL